jgi:hypothetical protein
MGTCSKCGGHVWDSVAGGMYGKICQCGAGARRAMSSNRGVRFSPTSEDSPPRGISLTVNPMAIYLQSRRAARKNSVSHSGERLAWPFYLICFFGMSLILYSVTIATIKIDNETYFGRQNPTDYVGFFGLAVLVITMLGRSAFIVSDSHQSAEARKMLEDDVVPVADRPRVPCKNCTKLVIAGSDQCVWCGFKGFIWECTQCDGVLELADNGLMYCRNCEDYWRK